MSINIYMDSKEFKHMKSCEDLVEDFGGDPDKVRAVIEAAKVWLEAIQAPVYELSRRGRAEEMLYKAVAALQPQEKPIPIQLCGGPEYIREHGIAGLKQDEEVDNAE